jgi:acetyl esterase/lipase
MVVVVPTYKLHPDATYTGMIDDVAVAVSWTIANIDQYSGNPKRIILRRRSAGAQLSAMAFMDPTVLANISIVVLNCVGIMVLVVCMISMPRYAFEQAHGRTARRHDGGDGWASQFQRYIADELYSG